LFWSQPINFFGPSYIEIAFAVLLNFRTDLVWDTWAMWVNNFCLFWFAIFLIVYPFWILYISITK
jgi:hypothetical protein